MARPLTVLQMLPALENGGVEKGTLEVAKALVEDGNRSIVISAGGGMVSQLQDEGSEHYSWPVDRKSLLTLRYVRPLRRFLREQNVDVLHYRSRMPGWVAYLAWKGMASNQRPLLVSTVHGLHSVNYYSSIMTKGEVVIAVSETVERYIRENYVAANADSIITIYRGVDSAAFPFGYQPDQSWMEEWRCRYPEFQGRFLLALPGRMTRLKGHLDFIQLVGQLKARGIPVMGLIIGGEDPKRKSYAAEVFRRMEEAGLSDWVVHLGQRNDMRELFSQCDLVLSLSSKPESFGRVVLEALSVGRPVVGYSHGGVGEILQELFPFGRVDPFCMDQLISKAEAVYRGEGPEIKRNSKFVKSKMLSQTIALYRQYTAS